MTRAEAKKLYTPKSTYAMKMAFVDKIFDAHEFEVNTLKSALKEAICAQLNALKRAHEYSESGFKGLREPPNLQWDKHFRIKDIAPEVKWRRFSKEEIELTNPPFKLIPAPYLSEFWEHSRCSIPAIKAIAKC